jgi:hypothetical protein
MSRNGLPVPLILQNTIGFMSIVGIHLLTFLRIGTRNFTLMRIRIRLPKMRRLHADPEAVRHERDISNAGR